MLFKAIKSFFNADSETGIGLSSLKTELAPEYFFDYDNTEANLNTKIKIKVKGDNSIIGLARKSTEKSSVKNKFEDFEEDLDQEFEAEAELDDIKAEITPAYLFSYANTRIKKAKAIEKHNKKKAVYVKERLATAQNYVNELNLEDAYITLSSLILDLSSELSVKNDRTNKYYSFSNIIEERVNAIINSKIETPARSKWITTQGVSYTEIYALYIKVLIGLEKLNEAQAALQEAMRWNPVSCKIYLLYGDYYRRQKSFKNCENALLRALELATGANTLAECYFKLAYLKKQMGQKALASALYVQGAKFSKKDSMAKNTNVNGIELIDESKALRILEQNNIRAEAGKLVQSAYYSLMIESKRAGNRKNFIQYMEIVKSMLHSKDKLEKLATIEPPR